MFKNKLYNLYLLSYRTFGKAVDESLAISSLASPLLTDSLVFK